MTTMKISTTKVIIIGIVVCTVIFGGFSYINQKLGLEDDNPIEEAIESLIAHQTGIDIDLTPEEKFLIRK